jgi:DNA-directed RNA polymerase subunit RPC12/RpoP
MRAYIVEHYPRPEMEYVQAPQVGRPATSTYRCGRCGHTQRRTFSIGIFEAAGERIPCSECRVGELVLVRL